MCEQHSRTPERSRDPRDARILKLEERNNELQYAIQDVRDRLEPFDHRPENFPEIVCLCGSTRFEHAFKSEQFRLTVEEQAIVLTVAGNWKDGHEDSWDEIDGKDKDRLDDLHFRKIELADRVHVLNVDGYVGSSTSNEIQHAIETDTEITWLEPENVPEEFDDCHSG